MDKRTLLKTTYALVLPSLFFREHINSKVLFLNILLVLLFYWKEIFSKDFFKEILHSVPFVMFFFFGLYLFVSNWVYANWNAPEFHFSLTWLGVGLLSYVFTKLGLVDWKRIALYFAITSIPMSTTIIWHYYMGTNLYQVFHGHVFTGILLAGNILLIASRWKEQSKLNEKIIWSISLILSVYTLFVLGSRMCLLSLALVFCIVFFKWDAKKSIIYLVAITLMFWGFYYGNSHFQERFSGLLQWNGQNPLFLRVLHWEGYYLAFKENWFFGIGHSNTLEFVQNYYNEINYQQGIRSKYHAHNQYLELMAKYGALAILLLFAFIIAFIRIALKNKSIWNLMWVLFLLLLNLTDNVLLSRNVSAVFFSFILFSMCFSNQKDSQYQK